ncbi:hypothetical protein ACIRUY_29755 [Streptomyces erythrochromogenes]|uniref:hypothetical protein n=1 Tax=Streptomyces erythrochromogenes TaxID=285574 RepID=UPI003433488E
MSKFDQPRRIRITAPHNEPPVIELDGQDVSAAVEVYRVMQAPGEAPEITLYVNTEWQGFGFDGLAEVMAEPADLRHVVIGFLDAVEWQKLDQAVLNRDDLDGQPGELTRGLLAQLREWAASA